MAATDLNIVLSTDNLGFLTSLPNNQAKMFCVLNARDALSQPLHECGIRLKSKAGAVPSAQGYVVLYAMVSNDGIEWSNGVDETVNIDILSSLDGATRIVSKPADSANKVINIDVELLSVLSGVYKYIGLILSNQSGDALSAAPADHAIVVPAIQQ